MLSEDDTNLRELSDAELERAWDLWFDLAQATNDADPPYSHGVFVNVGTGQSPDRFQQDELPGPAPRPG